MLSVVFDTVVFVRCLINPYSNWGRIVFSYVHKYRLFVSPPLLTEYLDVLHRPELTGKLRSLSGMDMRAVLSILEQAEVVDIGEDYPAVCRDPNDDMFLATARLARAEYLVCGDKDLLDLGEYEGTRILDGATFLGILEEEN